MCKVLANGYDCIKLDFGQSCVPWEVNYASGIAGGNDNLPTTCSSINSGDDCAIHACIVEGRFVLDIFQAIVVQQATVDSSLSNANGFQQDQICNFGTGQIQGPVECCGAYPERFKYRTNQGQNGCCVSEVYDTGMMECCANGSVDIIGNCP